MNPDEVSLLMNTLDEEEGAHKPGSHLTYELRCQIFTYLKSAISKRGIAHLLSCSHSTIVREVQRNDDQRGYRIQRLQNSAGCLFDSGRQGAFRDFPHGIWLFT